MLIRIVRMTFQSDKIEPFLENFHQTKDKIRNFKGCHHLELWQDASQSHIWGTLSVWESEEALNEYRKSALFEEVWSYTKMLFAEKPIAFSICSQEIVNPDAHQPYWNVQ